MNTTLRSPTDLMRLANIEPASVGVTAVLDAIYGMPLSNEQRRVISKIARTKISGAPLYDVALALGRGAHKTLMISWCAVFEALCGGHEQRALPGSRISGVIVAKDQRQSRDNAVKNVRAILDALNAAGLGVEHEVLDPNGTPTILITKPAQRCEVAITVMTSDADTIRSHAIFFFAADEAGFFPMPPNANTLRDVWDAVVPRMKGQFPRSRRILASTLGAPTGLFFDAVEGKAKGFAVFRGSSFTTSKVMTEEGLADLRRDDPDTYRREILSETWGFAGEGLLPVAHVRAAVRPASEFGPQPGGVYVGALDYAPKGDRTVLGIASAHSVELPGGLVRRVVVERLQSMQGSKDSPVLARDAVRAAVALGREFGTITTWRIDPHTSPEIESGLREAGYRVEVVSMQPAQQTPRWLQLRDLLAGHRIVIPDDPPEAAQELGSMTATMLSNGLLRVEGRKHDDYADVIALLAESAIKLPDTGGDIVHVVRGVNWSPESRELRINDQYLRRTTNGGYVPSDPPYGTPAFMQWMTETMLPQGMSTPSIERWISENGHPFANNTNTIGRRR